MLGQPAVTVEVELQTERAIRGDAEITQPHVWINEVDIVMLALAACGFQIGFVGRLVVPRLLDATALHRREDMHDSRPIPPRFQDGLNPCLFAPSLWRDPFDWQPIVFGQRFDRGHNFIA